MQLEGTIAGRRAVWGCERVSTSQGLHGNGCRDQMWPRGALQAGRSRCLSMLAWNRR